MKIATKLLRSQLLLLRPILTQESLEHSRTAQDQTGALMKRRLLNFEPVQFRDFQASFAVSREAVIDGAVLYLHGGGYTAGGLKYAEGFGSVIASKTGVNTLCPAYRLAPEDPYPAALEDAAAAYRFLTESGVSPEKIILAGESAGGGLCFALALYLRDHGLPMPGGIIAVSPWADLTLSGETLRTNAEEDPLLTSEQLSFFADCYAPDRDRTDPYISPLFGDLTGLPDTLLFAGEAEILLDDARRMHERLRAAGVRAALFTRPEMWHAYVLYGVEEAAEDNERIAEFIRGHIR